VAKILVADDNSNIQKMVGLALKDQGIDVVAVGNGEAAVRKISDVRPDLVLADVFMPVRNGYEVCRYVKEDSTLSHIPVILLVGAFDPLDEQEAQRVGADGVLKKPFVPPDPLISMVKSALTRAGVSIGNEPPPAEKASEPAVGRNAKDILKAGVSSKMTALSPAPIPEAEAEPLPEEFPAPPPSVKIAAGSEPVAFGSLLETPEAEDDMAFVSKPIEELEAARTWGNGEETDEPEEEEEQETPSRGGWRPGGLDESLPETGISSGNAGAKDWRDEAFHGNSPANTSSGRGWQPSHTTQVAEVAEAPPVGVSTLESKPNDAPSPFAGDAWAAALANTVEEKVSGASEAPAAVNQTAAVVTGPSEETKTDSPVLARTEAVPATPEPGNSAPAAESPWELEAKKASLLAATWDAPAPATTPANVAEAEKFLEEASPLVTQVAPSGAAAEAAEQSAAPSIAEEAKLEVVETPATQTVVEQPAVEAAASETTTESAYAWESQLDVNATQDVPVVAESESPYSSAPLEEMAASAAKQKPQPVERVQEQPAPVVSEPPAMAPEAAQAPDMDELVARVLAKMNPDVLQKVTQEILKPVIEAIIKDELNAKK
jgi:CheY-like chemotaxis protein